MSDEGNPEDEDPRDEDPKKEARGAATAAKKSRDWAEERAQTASDFAEHAGERARSTETSAEAAEASASEASKQATAAKEQAEAAEKSAGSAQSHAEEAEKHSQTASALLKVVEEAKDESLKIQENLSEAEVYLLLGEEFDGQGTGEPPGRILSLKERMEKLHADWRAFIKTEEKAIDDMKEELRGKILSLLPDAGAAGLAEGFFESKSRYGRTRSGRGGGQNNSGNGGASNGDASSKKTKWTSCFVPLLARLFSLPARLISPQVAHYVLFLAPLVGISVLLYPLFKQKVEDIPSIFGLLLLRGTLSAPLVVISIFGWRSIQNDRHLYEEYNHKQRVLQLYYSFKEEIGEKGTQEQYRRLISIMLDVVSDRPSLARGLERIEETSDSSDDSSNEESEDHEEEDESEERRE